MIIAVIMAAGILVTQQGFTLLKKEIDGKETSLDSQNEVDETDFPLLGFLVESSDKDGVPTYDYNQLATNGCEATVEGISEVVPQVPAEFKANSCIDNGKILYSIKRLKVSGCNFEKQESKDLSITSIGKLQKEFIMENIKIYFLNDELLCDAELVTNEERIAVSGNCAVAEGANFKFVNGLKPTVAQDPIYVGFTVADGKSLLEKKIREINGIGTQPTVLISASIPLSSKASDYLAYMLSNEAIDACESLKVKNKKSKLIKK
jgi:hypothetical protein